MNGYENFPSVPYDTSAVCCPRVAVHPRGALFVSQTSDELQLRHAQGGRPRRNLEIEGIQDFAFSPDGRRLAVGVMEKVVKIFDLESGEELGETDSADDYIDHVVWLGGPDHFAAASARGELTVYRMGRKEPETVREILEADPDYNSVFGLAATPSGSHLFLAAGESLRCFEAASGRLLWRRDFESSGGHLALSPDGRALAMPMADGTILFLDPSNGQPYASYQFRTAQGIRYPGMIGDAVSWSPRPAFSPDGSALVTNTPVGSFAMIDPRTGASLWEAPRARGLAWIEDVAWFPDGQYLLSACSDGVVGVWSMRPVDCAALLASYDETSPELD
jgi:WD40 repeat protein